MSSASEPDPMIRLRRRPAAPAPGLRAGVLVALVLGSAPVAQAAPPRAIPHLTDGPVRAIADRSTDPLANVPLRGRVAPRESMFGAANAPVATRPSVTVPATPAAPAGAAPAPVAAPAAEPPPWSRQPAAYPSSPVASPLAPSYPAGPADPAHGAAAPAAAPVDPRARATPPLTAGPPPVRSALPYAEPGVAAPQRPEPVTVARPMPAMPPLRPEIGAGTMPVAATEAVAPAPVAAPASPVTATLEPDGSVLLAWTVPASHVEDPFLVTILGPDEETAMRTVRTAGPRWSYPPEAQRIDFGLPVTDRLCVRVRSASDGAGRMNVAPVCIQVAPAS